MTAQVKRFARQMSWLLAGLFSLACPAGRAAAPVLEPNDVVAWVGGEFFVAAQENGLIETVLSSALGTRTPRFRSLAFEGDTVFEQHRQLNFPSWRELLDRIGATFVVCQFGQLELLDETRPPHTFALAYEAILAMLSAPGRRVVLLSPPPFEAPTGLHRDLTPRNPALKERVELIRKLAASRKLMFVDLFTPLSERAGGRRFTENGVRLNTYGHWLVALEIARAFELPQPSMTPLDSGVLPAVALETLRLEIVSKNRLWFDHFRPQNWAFLNGDRMDQPSSRDHRDKTVRWFPAEMEQFLPLIESREVAIRSLHTRLRPMP